MTREEILDLAKRVETLTGPNREVDKLVAKVIGLFDGARASYDLQLNLIPHYTASLDAAMQLVPMGWSVGLGDLRGYTPIIWRAHLRDHNNPNPVSRRWVEGNTATTPALALTAASLRAIAEGMEP